ncbi:MAG: hypothetical protein RLZZ303_1348 [Candidatus Hydrogenedentota bacterium]
MLVRALSVFLSLGLSGVAVPCSIFMAVNEETVLAGNNEDYYLDVTPLVWVEPGTGAEHGRLCWGFEEDKPRDFAQGGLNQKGLFFDAAVTPESGTKRIKGKKKAPDNMGDALLTECATVAEALAWLEQWDLQLINNGHLLLADATGDGAVVELHEGAMKLFRREQGNYVAATNFRFSNPGAGNFPCPRFESVRQYFKEAQGAVTPDAFRELLKSISVPRTRDESTKRDGGTLYSNVCDLRSGTVVFYRERDFDSPIVLSLMEELAKGRRKVTMWDLPGPVAKQELRLPSR